MTALVADPVVAAGHDSLALHGRSFRWASVFLPAVRRDDAAVLYGFCRLVDDTADTATDAGAARRDLDALASEVRGESPARPLVERVRGLLGDREGLGPALELIEGARSDLGEVRLADDAALLRYAYRVAGTVGLMMCRVLGADPRGGPFAIDLGVAMQITNICRDVAADAALGRVYLPARRLLAEGVTPEAIVTGRAERQAVARVVLDLLDLADRYYASADQGMRYLPARSRLAVLVAARVYRAIGVALRRRAGDPFAGRAFVSTSGKLAQTLLAIGAWGRLALSVPLSHDPRLHLPLRDLPGAHP